jgi:hypothetical protein
VKIKKRRKNFQAEDYEDYKEENLEIRVERKHSHLKLLFPS